MKFLDLTSRTGEWLRGGGPLQEVVISSRVRLARNLAAVPFLGRCTPPQRLELERRLKDEILQANLAPEMFYVDVAAASELDRQLLVERHLVSRQHAAGTEGAGEKKAKTAGPGHPRGVAISADETLAIMVNEEDHLRIQVLRSSLQLEQAVQEIVRVEEALEKRAGVRIPPPVRVFDGLPDQRRHGPAGERDAAPAGAETDRRDRKGPAGRPRHATGDPRPLRRGHGGQRRLLPGLQPDHARAERAGDRRGVPQHHPAGAHPVRKTARASLLAKNRTAIEDKVFRSLAILRSARTITSEETMFLLSMVRLGINLEVVPDVELLTVNELFLHTQPAHLQRMVKAASPRPAPASPERICSGRGWGSNGTRSCDFSGMCHRPHETHETHKTYRTYRAYGNYFSSLPSAIATILARHSAQPSTRSWRRRSQL